MDPQGQRLGRFGPAGQNRSGLCRWPEQHWGGRRVAGMRRHGGEMAFPDSWNNGWDGLLDQPRSGRPRMIDDADVERMIALTLDATPKDATH